MNNIYIKKRIERKENIKEYNKKIEKRKILDKDEKSIVIGILLGKSIAEKNEEGTKIIYWQYAKDSKKEYINWIYKYLVKKGYCLKEELKEEEIERKIEKRKIKEKIIKIEILRNKKWNEYYEIFYKNGEKKIPLNIEEYITPLALKIWIENNGGKDSWGLRINTKNNTKKEVELLREVLEKKYKIKTSKWLTKGKGEEYKIYIWKRSKGKIRSIK